MNPLWILLVHKGWERWTHAIGFGEPPQCISICVSANLIKWKTIELIARLEKIKKNKKKNKLKTSTKTARELRLDGETQEARRDAVIILKKLKTECDKEEERRKRWRWRRANNMSKSRQPSFLFTLSVHSYKGLCELWLRGGKCFIKYSL